MSKVLKADEVSYDPRPNRDHLTDGDDAGDERAENGEGKKKSSPAAAAALERARILQAARREAEEIVERAERLSLKKLKEAEAERARSDEVLEEARRRGFESGYAEGKAQGYQAGRQEGVASLEDVLAQAQEILDRTKTAQWELLEDARGDLLELAVAVAEKLVRRALRDDPETAVAILEGLLPKADGAARALVRISEESLEALGEDRRLLLERSREGCSIEIVPDDSLSPGDVVIETDWGLIDGRLRSRWKRVIEGLDLLEEGDRALD